MANDKYLFPFPADADFPMPAGGFGAHCADWQDAAALNPWLYYTGFFRFDNAGVAGAVLVPQSATATVMTAGVDEDGAGAGLPAGTKLATVDTNAGAQGAPGGDGTYRAYSLILQPKRPFRLTGARRDYAADLDRGGAGSPILSVNANLQMAVGDNLVANLTFGTSNAKADYIAGSPMLNPGFGGNAPQSDGIVKSLAGQQGASLWKVPATMGDFTGAARPKLTLSLPAGLVGCTPDAGGPAVAIAAGAPIIVPVFVAFLGRRLDCQVGTTPPCPTPAEAERWAAFLAYEQARRAGR